MRRGLFAPKHYRAARLSTGNLRTVREESSVNELRRILDEDAEKTARRVVRRHKFGRLSDRRIVMLLRPHADANGLQSVRDQQLIDLWFNAFATHVERLRGPSPAP
jgi:hypothetical protein